MKRLLLFFFLQNLTAAQAQTTLFSQDFNGSTTVSDYQSASPNNGQFTLIGAGGPGTTVSIESGQLKMDRSAAGNSGRFIRQASFPGPPTSLYVQFRISGSSVGNNNGAVDFNVGTISGTGTVTPNADVHSKIGIAIGGGGWQLRNIGGTTNDGQVITSSAQITWVINKTGGVLSYVPPSGGTSTVADGRADVWVDSRLAFDEIAAVTASQNLAQFKFVFDAGQGVLFIDDLLIRDVSGSLPVELISFRVSPTETGTVRIQWATAREVASRYFAVERSADALDYAEIARRTAAGTTLEPQRYEVLDAEPLPGTGYYRLRQVDFDGTDYLTRPQASNRKAPEGALSVFPNPSDGASATLHFADADRAEVRLFDATGRNFPCRFVAETSEFGRIFSDAALAPGLYLLRVQTPGGLHTLRWVRR